MFQRQIMVWDFDESFIRDSELSEKCMQTEDSGSRTKPPETGKLCVFSCNGVKVKYNTNVHDRWERFLRDVKAACIFKTVKTVLKNLFESTVFFKIC